MFVPAQLGHVVYVLLGISLGSSVTPETVATMVTWPLSMLALTIAMVAVTTSVMAYLKFVHGWDTLSALFAAAPGALAQAMALAQDTGADVRAIAMVQTVRLFILAVALPVAFAAFGVAGLPPPRGADAPLLRSIVELAVLIAASAGAGWLALSLQHSGRADRRRHGGVRRAAWRRLRARLPARAGRDLLLHRDGRDDRHAARRRRRQVAGAARPHRVGALMVGTTVGCLFALAVAWALSLRLADVVMAYVPGAIEAMTIIAFALHLDPVFVGVHHLARFTFMSMVLPAAVGLIRAYEKNVGEQWLLVGPRGSGRPAAARSESPSASSPLTRAQSERR